jgi:periplasmic divalent cation tolerance protein
VAQSAQIVVVLTNLPDRDNALELARHLVDARLAACVNVLAECTSIYRWKAKTETQAEVPVLIKTRQELLPELQAAIRARHPYELPEIVAIPVVAGLAEYLSWVSMETQAE